MRTKLAVLVTGLYIFLGVLSPMTAMAVDLNKTVCGGDATSNPELCADIDNSNTPDAVNPLYGPEGILTRAISGLSLVMGIIAILVIIIAGIKMSLSTGDAGKIKAARDQIIYAAVGLIVAVLAQGIVRFVLNRIGV